MNLFSMLFVLTWLEHFLVSGSYFDTCFIVKLVMVFSSMVAMFFFTHFRLMKALVLVLLLALVMMMFCTNDNAFKMLSYQLIISFAEIMTLTILYSSWFFVVLEFVLFGLILWYFGMTQYILYVSIMIGVFFLLLVVLFFFFFCFVVTLMVTGCVELVFIFLILFMGAWLICSMSPAISYNDPVQTYYEKTIPLHSCMKLMVYDSFVGTCRLFWSFFQIVPKNVDFWKNFLKKILPTNYFTKKDVIWFMAMFFEKTYIDWHSHEWFLYHKKRIILLILFIALFQKYGFEWGLYTKCSFKLSLFMHMHTALLAIFLGPFFLEMLREVQKNDPDFSMLPVFSKDYFKEIMVEDHTCSYWFFKLGYFYMAFHFFISCSIFLLWYTHLGLLFDLFMHMVYLCWGMIMLIIVIFSKIILFFF